MMDFKNKILALSKRLAFVLLLFVVLRLLLYFFNASLFNELSVIDIIRLAVLGMRFDISAILATNAIIIVMYLLPFSFTYKRIYQKVLNVLFVLINSINIIANLSDIIYFRFTLKRTTFEFANMFEEDDSMLSLIPRFILDYWYITFLGIAFIGFLLWFTRKTNYSSSEKNKALVIINYKSALISICIVGITILGIRGGLQLRPINIIDATKYTDNEDIAIVLNTPFTLMKTMGKTKLPLWHYYSQKELKNIINPIHNYAEGAKFRPLNIVEIIMESMSKEHSAYFNPNLKGHGFTPFLDSLMQHALVCEQAYANGRKSIEGIPAVLASFPSLLNDAFISSLYSSDQLSSLAHLLKPEGYTSAFFHGGNDGTMGFDNFVKSIGYEHYYGRQEYNNDKDFDGQWGIFDHKFFAFFGRRLTKIKQPFIASIFSLSAHHPYTLPPGFNGKFPKGKLPIQECMAYSDFALQQFFKYAKKQDWYQNTLFVITADHTSEVADKDFNNPAGRYAIPIVYFMPTDSLQGHFVLTTQQIDIMPSVLDYLHYPKSFYSLGNSIFSDERRTSISFRNGIYQLIEGDSLIQFNTNNNNFVNYCLCQWPKVAPCRNHFTPFNSHRYLKAMIQEYNYDLVNDKMSIDK